MNQRMIALLALLGVVLVGVLFYVFVWSPKSQEIDEIEAQIEATRQEQIQLQQRIAQLQDIRRRAPEIEASLVAAQSLIPADPALPVALRQLQLAADDSGVVLRSVAVGEAVEVTEVPELQELSIAISIEGGYYQLVDFLRRVEDPAITPRALLFVDLNVSPLEYPTLAAALSGAMFTSAPVPAVAAPPATTVPTPSPSPTPSPTPEGQP